MSLEETSRSLEKAIGFLEEEECGKVLRKVFWLFAGGDTGRWFEGKPQSSPSDTNLKKERELLSGHYSTEFMAGRVYRMCIVNYELSPDKRNKIERIMEKLEDLELVKSVNVQVKEDKPCWRLTDLGLACALSIKEDIKEGDKVTWDVEAVKKKWNGLEEIGTL